MLPLQRTGGKAVLAQHLDLRVAQLLQLGGGPNDVTGNWRFATVSEGVDMTQYAVEYYKQCFGSDSEIHFIIDDNSGTTTKLAYMFGNIDVLVKEHVKDEEFDAKTLGNGATLAEYFVDVETGEVEKVS